MCSKMIFKRVKVNLNQHYPGFSFVEMLMILTLLTVVSMPLLISMNAQNKELQKSYTQTTGNIAIDKLFDVVDPNIPFAARENFVVGKQVSVGETASYKTTTSVFCDPLSPAQDTARCEEGPFFFRRYALSPIDNKMTIEVGVSNKQNVTESGDLSIYQRRYEINSYRLFTKADSSPLVSSDNLGQIWYQEAPTESQNAPMAYTEKEASCITSSVENTSSITNKYITHVTSTCTPRYHFKVAPRSNYDLNMYFSNPAGVLSCQTNNDERSQHLVNIRIQDASGVTLADRRNIDIGTEVRKQSNAQAQEQLLFHTTEQSDIIVEPTVPSSCLSRAFANISAIELNRL